MKWICDSCARDKGLVLPPELKVSWHVGQCETCRAVRSVTDTIHFHHHTGANLPVDRGAKP